MFAAYSLTNASVAKSGTFHGKNTQEGKHQHLLSIPKTRDQNYLDTRTIDMRFFRSEALIIAELKENADRGT